MMRNLVIVLSLGMLVLSACSQAPAPDQDATLPAEQSGVPYPPPTATFLLPDAYPEPGKAPAPESPHGEMPTGAVIYYSRSGGIAGVDEQYTVYPDGRVEVNNGNSLVVAPEAVSALLTGLELAGIFSTPGYTSPPGACADCFNYTLIVSKDGQTYTAVVQDGDIEVPQGVQEALRLVIELLGLS